MKYRSKNGRATDGDQVWQVHKREYVGDGSPAHYKPPHSPTGPLPVEEKRALEAKAYRLTGLELVLLGGALVAFAAFAGWLVRGVLLRWALGL